MSCASHRAGKFNLVPHPIKIHPILGLIPNFILLELTTKLSNECFCAIDRGRHEIAQGPGGAAGAAPCARAS